MNTTINGGSESFTRTKSLTYDSDGLLETETTDPLKSEWVKNTYTRDSYGNITQVKTESPGLDTRNSYNTYDNSKHQFIVTKTNADLHSEHFTYDPAYGNILTHTDANDLFSEFVYDGFGRLTKTTLPSGKVINNTLHWDNNNSDFSRVIYYSKTNSTGSPESRTYADQLGRTWLDETQGYNGTFVKVESNYDANLKLSGKTLPYYQGGGKTWETYSYQYADGRLSSVTLGSDVKTYSYTDNTSKVKVTDVDGNEVEKDYNAFGQLDEVTDEGGTVSYTYYGHGGVKTMVSNGATYTIEYDNYERQKKLIDPDAGTINYVYNAYGELEEQTDAAGNKYTFEYDVLGRIETKTLDGGGAVTYSYDTEANGIGLLASVSSTGKTISYAYDDLSRVEEITKDISDDTYFDDLTFEYEYNTSGDVTKITYPSDFSVVNTYNTYGYLSNVKRGDNNANIWSSPAYNAMGQITSYTQGNNITTTRSYTAYGLPESIEAGTIQDAEYLFNQANGTLTWRKNHKHKNGSNVSFTETFGYDDLYRLTSVTYNNGLSNLNMTYNGSIGGSNGTIASKSGIGTYSYTGTRPHALTEIPDYSPQYDTDVEYTPFKKVSKVEATDRLLTTDYELNITYGPEEQRWKTVLTQTGGATNTKYFAGDYEIVVDNAGTAKHLHYIYADPGVVCVMEQQGTTKNMHYIHTDYLGSVEYITNASGTVEQELSYDAWGRLRNPSTWSYSNTAPMFGRGFTMHEHLTELNLINMNGRVYDPVIGIFLSPDNYVQSPDYTQNFNRYGYAYNNPLMYTDPSGEWIDQAVIAGLGFVSGYVSHGSSTGNWGWDAVVNGGISAGTSLLLYNTAAITSNFLSENGFSQGMSTTLGNAIGGATSSFVGNVAGQLYYEGSIDIGQAGQSTLYGFGGGVGSSMVDMSSIASLNFPMHHTFKHIVRSTAYEMGGNIFTGKPFFDDVTFGINSGMIMPIAMDFASLTSRYWGTLAFKNRIEKSTTTLLNDLYKKGISFDIEMEIGVNADIRLFDNRGEMVLGLIGKVDVSGYLNAQQGRNLGGLSLDKSFYINIPHANRTGFSIYNHIYQKSFRGW